jgi:hypothetical protein
MSMRWPGHRLALALGLAVLIAWLVTMSLVVRAAALEPRATGKMLAVFEPGTTQDVIFASLLARPAASLCAAPGFPSCGLSSVKKKALPAV